MQVDNLQRSRFKSLHILPGVSSGCYEVSFSLSYEVLEYIYQTSYSYQQSCQEAFVSCFSVSGSDQYLPTSPHARNQKKVGGICHYIFSCNYFRAFTSTESCSNL